MKMALVMALEKGKGKLMEINSINKLK